MNHFWNTGGYRIEYSINIFLVLLALILSDEARSQSAEADPASFRPLYLGISWSETFPVAESEKLYVRGGGHPGVSYRFFMHDHWLVSVSGGFKLFVDQSGGELPYFAITQQSSYLYRLYYPTWVAIGAQAMYLTATEKASLPYQRNRDIPSQIGAGLSIGIFYRQSDVLLVNAEISRWRGTANMDLQALEISIGGSYALSGM